jgi:hypothetical protein
MIAGLRICGGAVKLPKSAGSGYLKDIGQCCIVMAAFSIASRNHEAARENKDSTVQEERGKKDEAT